MFSIFKKTISDIEILPYFIDYHTHILSGVDDGVQKLEDSYEILRQYETLGISQVVFTPHIMEEYPNNKPAFLRAQFDQLVAGYKGNIKLRLGAEYMLDGGFAKHLQAGNMLTIKENYLLVETSYAYEPPGFLASIREARDLGYCVVLAHPERYIFLTRSMIQQLRQMGVIFQLNLPSLLGYYGPRVTQTAKEFLSAGEYSLLGSDIHRLSSVETIFHKKGLGKAEVEELRKLVNSE